MPQHLHQLQMKIIWKGKNDKEVGIYKGKEIIKIDSRYFRPTEVDNLIGDPRKAKKKLGWSPKINFKKLVKEMVEKDLNLIKDQKVVKKNNFSSSKKIKIKK